MLFTDVQRSARLNKKKKSTNTSPYPDEVIDRLARAFYPAILACWNSEEGQREFAAWQAEQAHHTANKEKQSVPDGERPVVHIVIVCGLWQGASAGTHPVFCFALNLLTHGSRPHSSNIPPGHHRKQIIRTHLLSETSSDYFCLVRVARIELTAS